MARNLAGFSVTRSGDEYIIALEDEDGETLEFTASYDQLDLMAEAVDRQLDSDEEDALVVEGGDEPS